jgi:transcriptional regulator with XRE-family HTH domain
VSQNQWIREGRKAAGWSQAELGTKVGVGQVQVSLWETGKARPTAEQERELRKSLRVAEPVPTPTPVVVRKQAQAAIVPPAAEPPAPNPLVSPRKTNSSPMAPAAASAKSAADFSDMESQLWEAADQLRANSKLTSSEYCMPVLGVIFLRHASNRYNAALAQIEADQAAGKMPNRPLVKGDFIRRRALMLPEKARYDELLRLPKQLQEETEGVSGERKEAVAAL